MANVVNKFPPNYDEICKHIPAVQQNQAIVFTYGKTIYSPAGVESRPDLMVHEQVHVKRQAKPKEWWSKYLTDIDFRLQEELVAYRAQYEYMLKHYDRAERRRILKSIAKDLSGSMYGKMVTKEQAMTLIKAGV